MSPPLARRDARTEIIIDNFAGGGGASTGIELALGRAVDVAINHDPEAIAMHRANHPFAEHYCESVWNVDPRSVHPGRPIGLLWLSPDCRHFSRCKGGKPVEKNIRGLAWLAVRWAAVRRPRVLMLENVLEFLQWGPLVRHEDGSMRPCPKRKGREFNSFRNALRRHGYSVEWRELRGCDYGAPTTRKRLFMVARCDGLPIVWPEPTHSDPASEAVRSGRLLPWRTTAECIDWSIPAPSIFLTKDEARAVGAKRPLADATMRRVGRGMLRFVVESENPFVVPLASGISVPTLITTGYGERAGQAPRVPGLDKPIGTLMAQGQKHALVVAFLAKHYGGVTGTDMRDPIGTVTAIDHHSLVTSHIVKLYGTAQHGHAATSPLHTISAQGQHLAEVRALLVRQYALDGREVPATVGTVVIGGDVYLIADIGLRMLAPDELFKCQGFPTDYIIDHGIDEAGETVKFTKTTQIRLVGNSVCPGLAAAIVRSNVPDMIEERMAA